MFNRWNCPNRFKEIFCLAFFGILLSSMISYVGYDLKIQDENNKSSCIPSLPNSTNSETTLEKAQYNISPHDKTDYSAVSDAITIVSIIKKLGPFDIILLVFIWPISLLFGRYSRVVADRFSSK